MRYFFARLSVLIIGLMVVGEAYGQAVKPWVTNTSKQNLIEYGLKGHHLAVWPSHGRYYNFKDAEWKWQRTRLFGTTEDLFTQSIVIPYLIPMLENAGANVFVPRERDWQTEERIVDNDYAASGYMERNGAEKWEKGPRPGFAIQEGNYHDGDRPFAKGTVRMVKASKNANTATAVYKPNLQVAGRYAVYVSYQTMEGSVDDAEYVVVHRGQRTYFRVNQQMGSGTWVYLGTFDFDRHSTYENYVMVTNNSSREGVVTTDAVRFGGGMGNHVRGGSVSGVPRAMECARYYAQFAGAPKAVVVSKGGSDDYGDDINTRSLMSNWLSYGSKTNPTEKVSRQQPAFDVETTTLAEAAAKAYMDSIIATGPDSTTLAKADSISRHIADSVAKIPFQQINVMKGDVMTGRVPLELQLAIHSDASWTKDFKSIVGTLAICTSDFNNRKLASGQPRKTSFDLACDLLFSVTRELQKRFPEWGVREVWDRNYSETRLPAQPSAILETLSHENFPDLRLAHDPYFKFWMARAIYKTVLKFIGRQNKQPVIVQPLAPQKFAADKMKANMLTLSWAATPDSTDQSAQPDGYVLYTKVGDRDYDNGKVLSDTTATVILRANTLYRFKVTATNSGGESFPTEELVAMYTPEAKETVMIVNAFHRLSSPTVIETSTKCGFDLVDDIGLSYGKTPAWCGRQLEFSKSMAGRPQGLGATSNELLGRFTAGNDFNYAAAHADAFSKVGKYNIVSIASDATIDDPAIQKADVLDILLGNEKDDGHSLMPYKTFTPQLRNVVERYQARGGRMLVSGSYIASDMQADEEREWLANNLHIRYAGCDRDSLPFRTDSLTDIIMVDSTALSTYRHVNGEHYASVASDIIVPAVETEEPAVPFAQYQKGTSAGVAYRDERNSMVTLGFPLECVKTVEERKLLMEKIVGSLSPTLPHREGVLN